MDWRRLTGVVAVAGVVVTLAGVLVTLAGSNPLVTASPWRTAALVTLAVVAGSLAAFALVGGPSDSWRSTPYW